MINKRAEYTPYDINPAVVVFDECETLYENPEDMRIKPLNSILRKFFSQDTSKASKDFVECNKHRQFIFCGSSMQPELVEKFK